MSNYLAGFGDAFDSVEYFEKRRSIGAAHERLGIKPAWYLAVFSYLAELIQTVFANGFNGSSVELCAISITIHKVCQLDAALAIETYHTCALNRIEQLMKRLALDHDEIRRLSQVDELTGLLNRRYFLERFASEVHSCCLHGRPLCLMLIDVDDFKGINDRYGHPMGDTVLSGIGELLLRCVRKIDLCGRVGGEELAVLLIETPLSTANMIAERIRLAILDLRFGDNSIAFSPSVSIGLSAMNKPFENSSLLYKYADDALYLAKRSGKNRVEIQSEEI
jgi:diguanylate cyclase (GGDEF)-like protein